RANLSWREVVILRAYTGFMRQARFPYSRFYMEQVLNAHPGISRALVALFREMHDPKSGAKAAARRRQAGQKILDMLQDVQKLDHDRILRSFKMLIENTLRTNYFQTEQDGSHKPCLAVKIDSKKVEALPLPRPHVEIFVYSRRV